VAAAVWLSLFTWLLLDLLAFGGLLGAGRSIVAAAHAREAWGPINRAFGILAEDSAAVGVAVYQEKLQWVYYVLGRPSLVLVALAAGVWIGGRGFPQVGRVIFPGRAGAYGLLVLTGLLLGFTFSIRPLAGLAGLLVAGYMIYRLRWASIGPLLVLAAVAALSTYLTWPWLWPAPVERLIQSVSLSADFEKQKLVLFRGEWYPSEATRWDYLPVLLATQLTEPIIPIFLVGLVVAVVNARRNSKHRPIAMVLLAWLAVVSVAYMLPGSVHYDNFRHLLFLLPAVFVIFGFGLHLLFSHVRRRSLSILLTVALLIPGVVGIVQLHPYEYVYYNSLVGGVQGAEGEFALDYWCTSYREAMAYVNEVAEPGASAMAMEPAQPARAFARQGLEVRRNDGDLGLAGVDFLLTCGRWLGKEWDDPELRLAHRVGKDGATFAEVFERVRPDAPSP